MHNTQTAVGIRPPWWPAGGRPPTSLFAYLRDAALALPLYPLSGSGHFAPGGISPPQFPLSIYMVLDVPPFTTTTNADLQCKAIVGQEYRSVLVHKFLLLIA